MSKPIKTNLVAALVIATAALAPAAHAGQDLRSPDARDAARQVEEARFQDLRSPDARDAARGVAPSGPGAPPVQVVEIRDGFSWGDAGLGAAGMLALLSIGTAGLMFAGRHRRRGGWPQTG